MIDPADTGREAIHNGRIGHAAQRDLGAEPPQFVREEPRFSVEHADLLAALQQTANEVAAGEASATGDEIQHIEGMRAGAGH